MKRARGGAALAGLILLSVGSCRRSEPALDDGATMSDAYEASRYSSSIEVRPAPDIRYRLASAQPVDWPTPDRRVADDVRLLTPDETQALIDRIPEPDGIDSPDGHLGPEVDPPPPDTTAALELDPFPPADDEGGVEPPGRTARLEETAGAAGATPSSLASQERKEAAPQAVAPLSIARLACTGAEPTTGARARSIEGCKPSGSFQVTLDGTIAQGSFDPRAVGLDPPLLGQSLEVADHTLVFSGIGSGNTEHRIRLPSTLRDIRGRTLGEQIVVTFETSDAQPALSAPGEEMVVIDAAGRPEFRVLSVANDALEVELYRVASHHWTDYLEHKGAYFGEARRASAPPGERVHSRTIRPAGGRDIPIEVPIDLSPGLTDGVGQLIVQVSPEGYSHRAADTDNRPITKWVQVTGLGLAIYSDSEGSLAWVTRLVDGRPIEGASVTVAPEGLSVVTDHDGLAILPAMPTGVDPASFHSRVLVAGWGRDVALLPAALGGALAGGEPHEILQWFVFTDRPEYAPGDEVHLKGWLRRSDPGKRGDIAPLPTDELAIRYRVMSSHGDELANGESPVSVAGGFAALIPLPHDAPLGAARIALEASGQELPPDFASHRRFHEIEIRQRLPAGPTITTTAASPHYLVGQRAIVTTRAIDLAGTGIPGSQVEWHVSARPTPYSPPGWDGYHFGRWQPWWEQDEEPLEAPLSEGDRSGADPIQTLTSHTDAAGRHSLAVHLDGIAPASAAQFALAARVQDIPPDSELPVATFIVHPAARYVGLRTEARFARLGEPIEVEVVASNLDGELVAGCPITLTMQTADEQTPVEAAPRATCTKVSGLAPTTCRLEPAKAGAHWLIGQVADEEGRTNETRLMLWITRGADPPSDSARSNAPLVRDLEIVPDADLYSPGDVARILVRAPFAPAEGLLSVRRSGLVHAERFSMSRNSTLLEVPIEEGYIPNVICQVDLVGSTDSTAPESAEVESTSRRPAQAHGSIDLPLSIEARELRVNLDTQPALVAPGGEATIEIQVTAEEGEPVEGAETALFVVDATAPHEDPDLDPLSAFYPRRSGDVSEGHLRSLMQAAPGEAIAEMSLQLRPAALGFSATERPDVDLLRGQGVDSARSGLPYPYHDACEDHVLPQSPPLVAFEPSLSSDADGMIKMRVAAPDTAGRYRVVAVATDGETRFAKAETALEVRPPIIVRATLPPMLRAGDEIEIPVVVRNSGRDPIDLNLVARARNLELLDQNGWRLTVPADEAVVLTSRAVAVHTGVAAVQAAAFSDGAMDVHQTRAAIDSPAGDTSRVVRGVLDTVSLVKVPLALPTAATGVGELQLSTSVTPLSELTDALQFLLDYPHEGAEQLASRVLGGVALAEVLNAPEHAEPVTGPTSEPIEQALRRLETMQNTDGGYGWWRRDEDSHPFVSVHVAHALARADRSGYPVDVATLDLALDYLRDLERHLKRAGIEGPVGDAIAAYGLYAIDQMGYPDATAARILYSSATSSAERPSVETLAWLASVMNDDEYSRREVGEIQETLSESAREIGGGLGFFTSLTATGSSDALASDERASAIVLDALLHTAPEHHLVPQIASGLLQARGEGRWATTQDNAFALLALAAYFGAPTSENPQMHPSASPTNAVSLGPSTVEPTVVARAWLGSNLLDETAFSGGSTNLSRTEVPLATLRAHGVDNVVIAKDGEGRLFWRLGIANAPRDALLEPTNHGLGISRRYEALGAAANVGQASDGTWWIDAGSPVRVGLELVVPERRNHVALVDPVPAGLEPWYPELTPPDPESTPEDADHRELPWWDHDRFASDRVEVFATSLPAGAYRYSYVARAATRGTYNAPAARAHELYRPQVFGSGNHDRLQVR